MRDEILSALSVESVLKDVRFFSEETPHRLAGTPTERKAAEYIKAQFDAAGVPMTIHELDAYVSFPGKARIEVLGPEPRIIEANTFAQAGATPPEGLEAELVHVGPGGIPDYEGVDAVGKITLSELSYAPPRPEKVRIAGAMGSVGQIMMNWGLPEHNTLPMGTCKPVWGNPTPENFSLMPKIPVVGIKLADGQWLAEQVKAGPVRVRMFCEAENRWGKALLPMARIEGNEEADKFVIVGGHYDAWGPGATDNGTGNSEVIEIARTLAKYKGKLRRSVVFAFWAAHETGIMEGSSWYVDRFWDDLTANAVLYLNVDSTGMLGASKFQGTASHEVAQFHRDLVKDVLGIENVGTSPLARTGDQSFFGIGVPSIYASHKHPPEQQKAWRGATLGWWYHSTFDTLDVVDPALLADSLKMHAAYTYELANRKVLPFDMTAVADVIVNRLADLAKLGVELNLADLQAEAVKLRANAERLKQEGARVAAEGTDAEARRFNETVLRLCRQLTSVTGTVSGRWSQDTYGLTALKTPMPGLYTIEQLAKLDPASAAYKLQWTETLRERNRAKDGVSEANRTIETLLG
ncbi:M28 family peptidase [Xanthobacter sp. ZOL 2024]